jgi:hypothetical protein
VRALAELFGGDHVAEWAVAPEPAMRTAKGEAGKHHEARRGAHDMALRSAGASARSYYIDATTGANIPPPPRTTLVDEVKGIFH